MQKPGDSAEESLKAQTEETRVAERRVEQNEALASARAEAAAKMSAAKASRLEANFGLSLAQGELKRAMGEIRANVFAKTGNRKEDRHRRHASWN